MSDIEIWGPYDDEFQHHKIFCGICGNDGWPVGCAYRPHTLDSSCWCMRTSQSRKLGVCYFAVEFGLAEPKPKPLPRPLDIAGREFSISFIPDEEFTRALNEAMAELTGREFR